MIASEPEINTKVVVPIQIVASALDVALPHDITTVDLVGLEHCRSLPDVKILWTWTPAWKS
jgi:hypothetical protein